MSPLPHRPIIAYELQARYAPGEAWITIDVCVSRVVAIEEGLFRPDPWGRTPMEVRVVPVRHGQAAA